MRGSALVLTLAACGRVAFDPIASGDAATDDALGNGNFLKQIGGPGVQRGDKIELAPDGTLGLVGMFDQSITLERTLTSRGMFDSFLAKYTTAGDPIWSVQLGGPGHDQARDLAFDGAGNAYLTGHFEGTVDFGGGPLTAQGEHDVFVVSYGPTGAFRWHARYGATASGTGFGSDFGLAIAASASGDVYVTGQYRGLVDFGSGFTLDSMGFEFFAFVLAIDGLGTTRWARSIGTTAANKASGVAADDTGVIATGYFQGTMDLGGGSLTSNGLQDIFVVSYDRDSAHRWSTRRGGTGIDWGHAVALDGSGNSTVGGSFQATVDFGGGVIGTETGGAAGFLASFDPSGVPRWSIVLTAACSKVLGLSSDPAGHVHATGAYNGSLSGTGWGVGGAGPGDAFTLEFNSSGAIQQFGTAGGSGYDLGRGVAATAEGGHFTIGHASGPDDCPSYASALYAAEDMFLAYSP